MGLHESQMELEETKGLNVDVDDAQLGEHETAVGVRHTLKFSLGSVGML